MPKMSQSSDTDNSSEVQPYFCYQCNRFIAGENVTSESHCRFCNTGFFQFVERAPNTGSSAQNGNQAQQEHRSSQQSSIIQGPFQFHEGVINLDQLILGIFGNVRPTVPNQQPRSNNPPPSNVTNQARAHNNPPPSNVTNQARAHNNATPESQRTNAPQQSRPFSNILNQMVSSISSALANSRGTQPQAPAAAASSQTPEHGEGLSRSQPAPQSSSSAPSSSNTAPGSGGNQQQADPMNPVQIFENFITGLMPRNTAIRIEINNRNLADFLTDDHIERLTNEILRNFDDQHIELNGISAELLNFLPMTTVTRAQADDEAQCSTCFEVFKFNEKVSILDCRHIFHKDCIKPWLQRNATCPVCRAPVDANKWRLSDLDDLD